MSLGVRFYLFPDEGLQRLSQRVMQGLVRGQDAMPQFAGTKQKIADVVVEMDKARPVKIARVDGSYLHPTRMAAMAAF
jgi:hypothetical protein